MGWTLSSTYLYKAKETARDVTEQYINIQVGILTPHSLENQITPEKGIKCITEKKVGKGRRQNVVENKREICEWFYKVCHPTLQKHLLHLSLSLLSVIHTVLPPF